MPLSSRAETYSPAIVMVPVQKSTTKSFKQTTLNFGLSPRSAITETMPSTSTPKPSKSAKAAKKSRKDDWSADKSMKQSRLSFTASESGRDSGFESNLPSGNVSEHSLEIGVPASNTKSSKSTKSAETVEIDLSGSSTKLKQSKKNESSNRTPSKIDSSTETEKGILKDKHVAIPLATALPKDSDCADMAYAFRRAKLEAVVSVKKEKAILRHLRTGRETYEDSEIVWPDLPSPASVKTHEALAHSSGDLIAFGHFLELLQNSDERQRLKKCRYDLQYLQEAITMENGGTSGDTYCSILFLLAETFREMSPDYKFAAIFPVRFDELSPDHLLACESLRQQLSEFMRAAKFDFAPDFAALIEKLTTTDVRDLSVTERLTLLLKSQDLLIRGTKFYSTYHQKLSDEKDKIRQTIKFLTDTLAELTSGIAAEDDKYTALMDRSNSAPMSRFTSKEISDTEKTLTKLRKQYDEALIEQKFAHLKLSTLQSLLTEATHAEHLGYDRHHNRYWFFPELSQGIFVESGWYVPLSSSRDTSTTTEPLPVVCNFVLTGSASGSDPTYSALYRLSEDGEYRLCSQDSSVPPSGPNQWFLYSPEQLEQLCEAMIPFGVREKKLRKELKKVQESVQSVERRAEPTVLQNHLEALTNYVKSVVDQLVKGQCIPTETEISWEVTEEETDIDRLKRNIIWIYDSIFPGFLHTDLRPEITTGETLWRESVSSTSNISRLYYLFVVLDRSIKWEFRITEHSTCDACSRKTHRVRLRRCNECRKVYHAKDCAWFVSGQCHFCRDASLGVPIEGLMNVADGVEPPSPSGHSSVGSARENVELIDGTVRTARAKRADKRAGRSESLETIESVNLPTSVYFLRNRKRPCA
ncbi:hypothetical protein RvY_08005 [Ramazzottius varieornatus]|uniref:WHIM2 domain-containing protein n=1 Tax=Ramazzottius varieornatus TaxID=947166 RepID=A0A1D1VA42_RAMVA|nr:hypothetical protein RvY_08005 [Ramazzottius varieornatus]